MLQTIPYKLVHLSSIWDAEDNLISEEIKHLWSKDKQTLQIGKNFMALREIYI